MVCLNCNRTIPNDTKVCPHCKAKVNPDIIRCPECWTRLTSIKDICPKCGCDVSQALAEREACANEVEETAWDMIKRLPLAFKIAVPVVIVAIIAAAVIYYSGKQAAINEEIVSLAEEYTDSSDGTLEKITEIAELYEFNVYDRDWIMHLETSKAFMEEFDEEIGDIKDDREPIEHLRTQIKELSGSKIDKLADEVYHTYADCYGYVIGENGSYPGYIKKYNKLLDKYEKAVKAFNKEIKKLK